MSAHWLSYHICTRTRHTIPHVNKRYGVSTYVCRTREGRAGLGQGFGTEGEPGQNFRRKSRLGCPANWFGLFSSSSRGAGRAGPAPEANHGCRQAQQGAGAQCTAVPPRAIPVSSSGILGCQGSWPGPGRLGHHPGQQPPLPRGPGGVALRGACCLPSNSRVRGEKLGGKIGKRDSDWRETGERLAGEIEKKLGGEIG
jgi:hypothetical protein